VTPRIVLAPLLGVALAGLARGQEGTGKKVEIVKYPVPGAEDAVGEVESPEARKVLDDFYKSKVLVEQYDAVMSHNADAYSRLMADRQVEQDERFGHGEDLRKPQVVANYRTGNQHMGKLQHDHVRLVAFGENTVVVTGHSTSVLHHQGKLSNGPRLLTEIWVKLDGRWQRVVHAMSDLDGLEDRANE
jgi:uncharacterized protein DUF4440